MEHFKSRREEYLNFFFDPYQILDIKKGENPRTAFYQKVNTNSLKKRIQATLAFDVLSTKVKGRYKKINQNYQMQQYGVYEAALVSDCTYLRKNIKLTYQKLSINEHERSLLYTCCRSGYYDCVLFLLQIGSDVASLQQNKSTPLHVAAFYGHENIVKLLIAYGSSNNFKNEFNHTPSDEGRTNEIVSIILNSKEDVLHELFEDLKSKDLAECMERRKDDQIVRIYKKGQNGQPLLAGYLNNPQYVRCFHGTNFDYLELIVKLGLVPSGTENVLTKEGHIDPNLTFEDIKNWGRAIFLSPSPFYAANQAYSERKLSNNRDYCCLVEALVMEGAYTKHKHTLLKKADVDGEPGEVEYRVAQDKDIDIIRVGNQNKVIVFSVLFIDAKLLEDQVMSYEEIIKLICTYEIL